MLCGVRNFLSSFEHGTAEAAVGALHLGETGKNGADAEVGGFSAVDAREKRVGEAVDHFRAVMALDERCDAFVGMGGARGME